MSALTIVLTVLQVICGIALTVIVLFQSGNNIIAVFDWYGNYVGTIKVRLTTENVEPESIDVDDQGRLLVVASKRIWYVRPQI